MIIESLIVGSSTHSTAWFNNQAFHTPATSIAYMDQAYLRYTTNRNFLMSYHNFPLPRNSTERVQDELLGYVIFADVFSITYYKKQ